MPRLSIPVLVAGAALSLAVLTAAPASAVQRTLTIQQIQDTTLVNHFVEGSTDTITTTGVITASDTRRVFGIVLQDPAGGPFSGIYVVGEFNMFVDSSYARGDLITVTGRVTEFQGLTQIVPSVGFAGTNSGNPKLTKIGTAPVPAPIALASFGQIAELAAYQFTEQYEGVLVSIDNIRAVRNLFPETWLGVDNDVPTSTDTVRVDGFTLCDPVRVNAPAAGVVATSVTGVGGHSLPRGYGINLRNVNDMVVPSPPALLNAWATSNTNIRLLFDRPLDPATAEDETKYSRVTTLGAIDFATVVGGTNSQVVDLTTSFDPQIPGEPELLRASAIKSALGVAMPAPADQAFRAGITPIQQVQTNAAEDTSQYVFQQVTVRGIVHARDGGLYYIQDGTGTNPSSGMALFNPITILQEGDDVTVSGTVIEFGSLSQLTEYSGLNYQVLNAAGVAKYTPVVVSPGAIGALTGSEPFPGERYEAMFVEMQNVTVVQDSLPNGQFLVQGGGGAGDTVRVDDTMFRQDHLFGYGANFNTTVPSLRGLVNDSFGQYTVNPRDSADAVIQDVVGVEPGAGGLDFAIRGITPTPVSFARGGSAIVNFTMPAAGRATLRVYDVAGRLVSTPLSNVEYAAGPQAIALDARNLGNGRLGSGIFFVQLQLGNRLATAKLVVTD